MGRCHLSDCGSGPCLLCRRWALGCKWNAVASDNARVDTTCQDAAPARPSLHSVYNSVSCVCHTSTRCVHLCFPVSITRRSRTVTHWGDRSFKFSTHLCAIYRFKFISTQGKQPSCSYCSLQNSSHMLQFPQNLLFLRFIPGYPVRCS